MTVLVKKGHYIFREKQSGREMYYVHSGKVQIVQDRHAKKIPLATLEKGSVFGEMALIDGKPRSAGAIALEDSELVVVSKLDFTKQIQSVPPWYMALIRVASEYLRQINEKLIGEQRMQTIANISQLLVLLGRYSSAQNNGSGNKSLELRHLKKELMEILGINSDPLNQALQFLSKNEFIKMLTGTLTIEDPEKLKNFAEFARTLKQTDEIELMDPDLLEHCTRLKQLLDNTFSKKSKATFSYTNFRTEMIKNAGFAGEKLEEFLKEIQKIKVVQFISDKGQPVEDPERLEKNGQLKFDSKYLGKVLEKEGFKRLDLST